MALLLCSCHDADIRMSIAPNDAVVVRDPFDASVELVEVASTGTADSLTGSSVFGLIVAAEWLQDRTVVVADAMGKQLLRISTENGSEISIGRPGSGPGEFLSVAHVASIDSIVYAYDDRLDRLLAFTSDGMHWASADLGFGLLQGLRGLSAEQVLALRMAYDGAANMLIINADGEVVDSLGSGPHVPTDWLRDPFAPAGAICVHAGTAIYANPLASELAAYNIDDRQLMWVKRYPNALRDEIIQSRDGPPRPQAVLISVACDAVQIVLTYAGSRGDVYHDFFHFDGTPFGRHIESQRTGQPYVGGIVAVRNDTVLAYNNRPVPRISVQRVIRN